MAHRGNGLPKRAGGYRLENDDDALPVVRLRWLFLRYVREECPDAYETYLALTPIAGEAQGVHETHACSYGLSPRLRWHNLEEAKLQASNPHDEWMAPEAVPSLVEFYDGVVAWADRFHLRANWVLEGAVEQLTFAAQTGHEPVLGIGTSTHLPPFTAEPFAFVFEEWIEIEGLEAYGKRLTDAFVERRDAYIGNLKSLLEETGGVVPMGYMEKDSYKALRNAAAWQTKGLTGDSDEVTIRNLLKRIGLKPATGLKH